MNKSISEKWMRLNDPFHRVRKKRKSVIYIVIHRQTVSFYQNSSVWLDTQEARSRDRNPSNFTLDWDSDHSSTKRTMLAKGILRYFFYF